MKIRGRDIFLFVDFDEEESKKRKGYVHRRRPEDLVKRRLRDNDRHIRHYDLGWFANGESLDFHLDVPITEIKLDLSVYPSLEYHPPKIMLDTIDPNPSLLTQLLAYDKENWDSLFMEVTPDNRSEYFSSNGTGVTNNPSDYILGKGWRVYDATTISNGTYSSFNSYGELEGGTTNNANYKVTSDPSYSADPVSFSVTGNCKMFSFPKIRLWHGQNWYKANGWSIPGASELQILGLTLMPIPRAFTHFNSDYDTYVSNFATMSGNQWMLLHNFATTDTSLQIWLDLFLDNPHMRLRTLEIPSSFTTIEWNEEDLPSSSPSLFRTGFDYSRTKFGYPLLVGSDIHWSQSPWVSIRPWHRLQGQCVALVKQNNDWFYIWENRANALVDSFIASGTGNNNAFIAPRPFYQLRGGIYWTMGYPFSVTP